MDDDAAPEAHFRPKPIDRSFQGQEVWGSRMRVQVSKDLDLWLTLEYPPDGVEGLPTVQQAVEVLAAALATMVAKDRAYGGAWREQGWMGNLARIMSKAARLRNLLWRDLTGEENGETVADTIQDMINLLVFMTLNRQRGNRWGHGGTS